MASGDPQPPNERAPNTGPRPPTGPRQRPFWVLTVFYAGGALLLLTLWQGVLGDVERRTIPYSEFQQRLANGEVESCLVGEAEIKGRIVPRADGPGVDAEPGEPDDGSAEPFEFRTTRVDDPGLVEALAAAGIEFRGARANPLTQLLMAWVVPLGLLAVVWIFLMRRLTPGQSVMSFGKSRARLVADREVGVDFDDVAGCDEAKAELREIVDFLRDPRPFQALGAHIPKGVLVVGPPGTGKTLIARAVAGEAGVPFFSLSGSDFVEMFVGVGAARVRDLFTQAKQMAPCIVFIDELDAIGRRRSVHMGSVNDEREHTLNQLLVELDGFEPNLGVILLAATNRPDVLDPALLRPGRFDRQVVIDSPDAIGRRAILGVHARGKPLAPDVDLEVVARATPGFSGADLANAINEAALLAARRGAQTLSQRDLEDAVEKVVAGPERKSRRLGEKEKRRIATHEVGHALVAAHSKTADPVRKISIVPRGRAALGYTLQLPTGDRYLYSRSELMDRLRGLLGGRAAEEVILGEPSTGAENDLQQATALVRQVVCLYGMGESAGLMHCAQPAPGATPDDPLGALQRDCSEATAHDIDEEVRATLEQAYADARAILVEHRVQLELITAELLERETLDEEGFRALLAESPVA